MDVYEQPVELDKCEYLPTPKEIEDALGEMKPRKEKQLVKEHTYRQPKVHGRTFAVGYSKRVGVVIEEL